MRNPRAEPPHPPLGLTQPAAVAPLYGRVCQGADLDSRAHDCAPAAANPIYLLKKIPYLSSSV